jgi:hypothetical protein
MRRAILFAALFVAFAARAGGGRTLFIESAVENPDDTATFPLYRGTSNGQSVWYVIFNSSDGADAEALGAGEVSKLANARGSRAVQKVTIANGIVDFPGTVNFAPDHKVAAGPQGFPPAAANPGSVADQFYISTDSSLDVAAALEGSTFVPRLNEAPSLDDDSTHSSRASLAAFVNGQTGKVNPQRQGLNSALLDGADPLNVLRWSPSQGRYSPLWDVHLAAWTPAAVSSGRNLRQMDYGDVQGLASHGLITAPDGTAFAASGFIVNCPIVSEE